MRRSQGARSHQTNASIVVTMQLAQAAAERYCLQRRCSDSSSSGHHLALAGTPAWNHDAVQLHANMHKSTYKTTTCHSRDHHTS